MSNYIHAEPTNRYDFGSRKAAKGETRETRVNEEVEAERGKSLLASIRRQAPPKPPRVPPSSDNRLRAHFTTELSEGCRGDRGRDREASRRSGAMERKREAHEEVAAEVGIRGSEGDE